MSEEQSTFLHHVPCDSCGSSDANSLYTDGHQYCYACEAYVHGDGSTPSGTPRATPKAAANLLESGHHQRLASRGITEETCRKFNYTVAKDWNGKPVQVAPYHDQAGQLVAQKLRYANKEFSFLGDSKGCQLFGQRLWKAGGKKLVITEGEIDALTVSQVQSNKWPVVSVPKGAKGAKRAVQDNYEYVSSFDEIIIFFDDDEAGNEAAQEVAAILPPSKAFVARCDGFKDANEALQANRADAIVTAVWQAKPYRPDGLVSIGDLREELLKPIERGLPYWDKRITEVTYGRRYGEIVGLGAGTGVGKTDWIAHQVAYDVTVLKEKVGLVFLEQKPKETCQRIAGKIDGAQYHVPENGSDQEQMMTTLGSISDLVTMYDSFGQTDWEVVSSKIAYMAQALGTRIFYVDHLTAMADTSNERESLEQLMKDLAGLANQLNVWIMFVSHLATPEGKPHEEGGHVSIRHFKGSRAIGFWSHFMFALERNQQAEKPEERSVTTFRILKDRFTGLATGLTYNYNYDHNTGRSIPIAAPPKAAPKASQDYGF